MQKQPFIPSRLAPDVRQLVEELINNNSPMLSPIPIPEMREAYKQVSRFGGESLPVKEVRNLQIPGPVGPISLRFYLPEQDESPYAATIYLHGGGWCIGSLDTHDKVCRRLVHTSGHAVIAIDYRLAPEYPAPAGPEDVLAAIRWLYHHAEETGLDPQRLAVAGDSAGGSLTAVATQQLRGEVPFRAQVLFYPCTDLSPSGDQFPSRFENANIPPLTLEMMHAMADPFAKSFDAGDTRLSPLLADDFHHLPPALLVTGECDVLRDDGRFYRDALEKADIAVEYVEVEGMVHGFIEMSGVLPAAAQMLEKAGKFLNQHLA